MGFLLPFFSAGAAGLGSIFDKLNLRRNGIGMRALLALEFLLMFLTIGAYLLFARIPFPALDSLTVGLVFALMLISFAQNIFELKGIQAMHMNMREPIRGLEPILAGVLAYLIFPSEGNVRYLIAIIAGAVVVMWSSGRRFSPRTFFSAGSGYVFADVSLGAIEDNLTKFMLIAISAAYIPFFRSGGVLLLCLLFLRPARSSLASKGLMLGIWSGLLFGLAAIARVYAIQRLGLNLTILVLLLEPGLIYLLSYLTLKERFSWRPIIGSVAIAVLILLAVES